MNKLIGILFLGLGLTLVCGMKAEAASSRGGAKSATALVASSQLVGVSSAPATLYAIYASSIAASAATYIAVFDTSTVVGLAVTNTSVLKGRFHLTSAGTNAFVFDPPIAFRRGLFFGSSTTGTTDPSITVIWEPGINLEP